MEILHALDEEVFRRTTRSSSVLSDSTEFAGEHRTFLAQMFPQWSLPSKQHVPFYFNGNDPCPRNLNYGSGLQTKLSIPNSSLASDLQPEHGDLLSMLLSENCSVNNMEDVSLGQLRESDHRVPFQSCRVGAPAVLYKSQPGRVASGKHRIRWTNELHEQFVRAVDILGGAMKATPKEILKLMKFEGLTIFHIKSHLQKYRTAKYNHNLIEGNIEKRTKCGQGTTPHWKGNGRFQISETLHLQMQLQKSLHEHLEVQRKLQMRIEAHANYLDSMFEQQNRRENFEVAPLTSNGNFGVYENYDDNILTRSGQ